eukprot:9489279-Pyramimonas_sp.AAC.1
MREPVNSSTLDALHLRTHRQPVEGGRQPLRVASPLPNLGIHHFCDGSLEFLMLASNLYESVLRLAQLLDQRFT